MTTTLKRENRRDPDDPVPTVAQVEDAPDRLLIAITIHGLNRRTKFTPDRLPRMHFLGEPKRLPGEDFVEDPIGEALRVGVKRLGQTLFALTGSLAAMHESCERVANRDRALWGWRGDIMDKQWDGIGDGNNRWSC